MSSNLGKILILTHACQGQHAESRSQVRGQNWPASTGMAQIDDAKATATTARAIAEEKCINQFTSGASFKPRPTHSNETIGNGITRDEVLVQKTVTNLADDYQAITIERRQMSVVDRSVVTITPRERVTPVLPGAWAPLAKTMDPIRPSRRLSSTFPAYIVFDIQGILEDLKTVQVRTACYRVVAPGQSQPLPRHVIQNWIEVLAARGGTSPDTRNPPSKESLSKWVGSHKPKLVLVCHLDNVHNNISIGKFALVISFRTSLKRSKPEVRAGGSMVRDIVIVTRVSAPAVVLRHCESRNMPRMAECFGQVLHCDSNQQMKSASAWMGVGEHLIVRVRQGRPRYFKLFNHNSFEPSSAYGQPHKGAVQKHVQGPPSSNTVIRSKRQDWLLVPVNLISSKEMVHFHDTKLQLVNEGNSKQNAN
ncbi:uncharacterized protein HD556DRAFT_1309130 [Suillus plorans]|uniref:Uncharacterized protein n=1 Tax=Suillus plorans TaxID=116603 RepID=A0A9P7AML1_9AGAM|nr:uncharacterized protein HD556DRAFT_1309130 [Suillus plorans]KAG1792567.1 hypothetical protein HD556DRAFT_1309130 [Suillus plorans]